VAVVVVVVCPVIVKLIEVVQVPTEVTVICVAVSLTVTCLPAINSDFVAELGVTVPTFAVKLKFGPVSAPKPESKTTVTTIFYNYSIFLFLT
jgi:hypothetical protein